MVGIPVAIYGKDPKMAETVREKLLPDYEVVHACLDVSAAEAELPALCGGDTNVSPSSGLGTNASIVPGHGRKIPVAVFFGGGFSDDEFQRVSGAVRARAPAVHFVKCQKRDVLVNGGFGPNPDIIAKVYRKKMAALAL